MDEPTYGGQLQDRSILSVPVEGSISIRYEELPGRYPDGTSYSLRQANLCDRRAGVGPGASGSDGLAADRARSNRHGLLEAIPEERIMALADPDDADGDGISGRANRVWDVRHERPALGRFGWKANQPTVEQQGAGAFLGDIGITSSLFPEENCPPAQTACQQAPTGGSPEIPDDRLAKVTFYVQTLAVPAMRRVDEPEVKQGARLFVEAQCAACHTPRHVTAADSPVRPLRDQVIFPYTDLLLHDMGAGLADGRPDGLASGREWRTPPLWGLGTDRSRQRSYDAPARRASTYIEEAILWHGGEAQQSRDYFMNLSSEDRAALLEFLRAI